MSKQNPILDRAVITYLPENHLQLFVAEQFITKTGKAELGRKIFREHYANMAPFDRRLLEDTFKKMTNEQKKSPNKD